MSLKLLPRFTAIAACARNGVMGNKGKLPWHYPADLKHFRETTLNQVMVVGRKTFESMPPQLFKERTGIVLTKTHLIEATQQAHDLEALEKFYSQNPNLLGKTQFVIGGREIFDLFFNHELIERAIITHIHTSHEGDVNFPLEAIQGWEKKRLFDYPDFSIWEYRKL